MTQVDAAPHPRLTQLLQSSRRQRWPYTPVQAWADRAASGACSETATALMPADLPGWQQERIGADSNAMALKDSTQRFLRTDAIQGGWNERSVKITVAEATQATVCVCMDDIRAGVLDLAATIELRPGSQLHLIRIADFAPMATVFENWCLRLGENAELRCTDINLGAGRNHVDTLIELQQAGAQAHWQSISLLGGDTRAVNQLRIEHQATHTLSRLEARNVLADRARRSLIGMIKVGRGAEGTDSAQMCRSVLLSQGAGADMRPELEIYNDAVKCAHGATCGALDDDALHYMRTRGLDRRTARKLLLQGFCQPVLDTLPETLRPHWAQRAGAVLQQLGNEQP